MDEKIVIITETDDGYKIDNKGISEFALLGILECVVFDMKTAARKQSDASSVQATKKNELIVEKRETASEQKQNESESKPAAPQPDLRTRISNAIKAINGLGGNIEETDLSKLTDEELKAELEELTAQYKRLKTSTRTKQ